MFGVWPLLTGLFGSGVLVVSGIVEGLPLTLLVTIGIVGFAALFSLGLSIRLINRAARADEPAYEMWDHIDEFMVFQAACLWMGREPKRPVPSGRIYAIFTLIKESLRNGTIKPCEGDLSVDQFIRVKRSELRKLAEAKNMRPRFLFPNS